MKRTPTTVWRSAVDEQRMMIWKIVAYDNFYGMCMTISRNPDEFAPNTWIYCLPEDADENVPVTLTLQKRGQIIAQMQFELQSSKGEILLVTPNLINFTNVNDTVNLFQVHILSDTIIFQYTTKEGKQSVFKFPLTGFNERYLEQFI